MHIYEEEDLIKHNYAFNSLDFLNAYHKKDNFVWPESKEKIYERATYCEKQILNFALENPNLIVIWISHGFYTEMFAERTC